jgi:hypothetical protein
VLGAVDWGNLQVAGAFLLGAIFATIATLRVVRAVTNFFAGVDRTRRLPRRDDDKPTDGG